MRNLIRNAGVVFIFLFVGKMFVDAGPAADERVDLSVIPKSLILAQMPEGKTLPTGQFKAAHLVKTLNAAALQKGL